MKPYRLTLNAWGPYRDSQCVNFETIAEGGLFLVTGPTGAGKTTVFDAITFALYGEVSGSVREKDSLRSDFAEPSSATCVELIFGHRGERYRILRNPRYDRAKLRGDGVTTENENAQMWKVTQTGSEEQLAAAGSQQVTDAVVQLLGMDYRQFKQISMIAQGEFTKLLMAASKERTLIFRDIFQTRLYDTITQLLNQRVRALTDRLDEVKSRMDEAAGSFRMNSERWEKAWNQKNRNYDKLVSLVSEDLEEKIKERAGLEEVQEKQEKEYKSLVQKTEQARQNNRMIEQYRADEARLEEMKRELEEISLRKKELTEEAKQLPQMIKEEAVLQGKLRDMQEQYKRLVAWKQANGRLTGLQQEYLRLDGLAKHKRAEYEFQEDCCRKAAAGILAQGLKAGMPCPVCGSLEHPFPATVTSEIPDEKKLKQLKAEAEQQSAEANRAQAEAAAALGAQKQLEENLGELAQILYADQNTGAGKSAEKLLIVLTEQGKETAAAFHRMEDTRKKLEQDCRDIEIRLEKQKEAVRQKKETLKKPKDQEVQDIGEWNARVQELEAKRRQLAREKEALQTIMSINRSALKQITDHQKVREQLEAEYGVVRKVERAASGSNNRKLVLEQYVLSVYFEDILRAANLRLRAMTGERYELYRQEELKDRRMKEGMELEVLDQYTGKRRSVKTLSGGESFKAALALALGTSDVVQSYAGGILVETLFVDEGFGALDSESLAQAIDILMTLSDNRCMIGIISHVEELKERVDHQIIVEKSNNGSSIHTNFAVY